jgi:ribosomal protein L4
VLSRHAADGTLGVLDGRAFSSRPPATAMELAGEVGQELPQSWSHATSRTSPSRFRNIDRVVVTTPGELEVAALVWARSVLVTEEALELVQEKAS